MRADHELSRVSVSFDERNLVPNAGLQPAAVLAQRLDLSALIDRRLHLATHGANSGAKALSVIGSMFVGGDSIDDVAVLRAGEAASLFDRPLRPDIPEMTGRARPAERAGWASRPSRSHSRGTDGRKECHACAARVSRRARWCRVTRTRHGYPCRASATGTACRPWRLDLSGGR